MKKQKRAKLVFSNYACLREWVWRTTESEDPDTDPSLLVKTAESGCDVAPQWKRMKNNIDWEYVSMHPCGGPVRKIESFGRLIKTYDSFPLAKFLGNKDNPFWLINYNGADSVTSRCRKDLFTILVNDFRPKQVHESSTDQFAFVLEPLFHVTADNIHRNWQGYVDSFIERIEEIGKRCNTWLSSHSELAFQSVAREYVQLGRYVGKSAISIADLAEHVTKARDNLNAQKVLRKLKEK